MGHEAGSARGGDLREMIYRLRERLGRGRATDAVPGR
jgi:hypothetical protein